ncbi:conserved hypothetical protein [Ricinus communis]|uniref:UGSC-like domain-containing protein n=1 Tax=Ricinus communis TaxID=3988 RepID=B9TFI4_RICCO|nr:conserved hypothetical protein [Ricinus communis]
MNGKCDLILVMCPEHARCLGDAGWSKARVQQALFDRLAATRIVPPDANFQETMRLGGPEDLHLVVAGGFGYFEEFVVNAPLIGLDPTAAPRSGLSRRLAPRPASLEGATIALVINGLGRAEELMHAIYDRIAAQVPNTRCLPIMKTGTSVPPAPGDWEKLIAQADVAITGFGGCGSCSTRSFRDAIELEWAGVPSATMIHEAVNLGVRMLARLTSMEDYPYALVGAPFTNLGEWTDAEIEQLADLITPQVLRLLQRESVQAVA